MSRLDLNVLFKGVLVEQCFTSTEVGHGEMARDVSVLTKFRRFLHSNNMHSPDNVVVDGTW